MREVQLPATVLVVDDDIAIGQLLKDFLKAEGFHVLVATDADKALAMLHQEPIDCMILDVMMPGRSGFDLCRQIRETSDLPILFLSAYDSDREKLRGFGLKGDDYISKSASPGEIVARVKAVLRRSQREQPTTRVLDFGRLVIDLTAHEVRVAGRPVPFTTREFALLSLLAEHPRQVFTREQLFERFWGDIGDRQTVTVHIRRIREKIEENPAEPHHIITVRGVGYRFEGEKE
ncbi:DNA-binding response OmpR family regulator [Thermosporothrix hazakensis]|uniref:DNA-binding response OmpR family regulator n=2 Tax=Thermosporothrix TaxID=768650 RepID=A0A326UDC7_THEHA|nr:response regulator transcription factor [Thermosporothrix hazakensis]PZW32734.1 DNA-binding response OmpR family regulator [Thermosporothrix hazakensis]BBH87649.1 DNA-binding response regulator [Thermosporothrix sp. COM3]GCE50092.1 DNA-binding response regulator [Thermosporothrix hazakensis]